MPPIPVHLDDPIVPQKSQDATTQPPTDPEASRPLNQPATLTQNDTAAYPPARPGAAAVPAPTNYAPRPAPEPTRTQPQTEQSRPPPPQPGAVPVPPGQQPSTLATSTLPPPPKPGEAWKQPQTSMPSQMGILPPSQNYAPTHSTTSYIPPGGATTVNLGPVTATPLSEHPLGYHQNTHAQDMTPSQRLALDGQERRDGLMGSLGGDSAGETAGNMWNAVKGWATAAGEKLAETEEQVWKRINGN